MSPRCVGPEPARASGHRVWRAGLRDDSGRRTTRVISELAQSGHLLEAWCDLRDDERAISLRNVLGGPPHEALSVRAAPAGIGVLQATPADDAVLDGCQVVTVL